MQVDCRGRFLQLLAIDAAPMAGADCCQLRGMLSPSSSERQSCRRPPLAHLCFPQGRLLSQSHSCHLKLSSSLDDAPSPPPKQQSSHTAQGLWGAKVVAPRGLNFLSLTKPRACSGGGHRLHLAWESSCRASMNLLQGLHCAGSQRGLEQVPLSHQHLLTPGCSQSSPKLLQAVAPWPRMQLCRSGGRGQPG